MEVIYKFWTTATTKYRILTGRTIAFIDVILATFLSLAIKKATHISSTNILLVRCLSAFVIIKIVMDKTGTPSWAKTEYDQNTFIARGLVGGVGTIITTLALKATDLQVFSVIQATGVPMTVFLSRLAGVPQPTVAYVSSATVFLGIYLVVFEGFVPSLKNSKKGTYLLRARDNCLWGRIQRTKCNVNCNDQDSNRNKKYPKN